MLHPQMFEGRQERALPPETSPPPERALPRPLRNAGALSLASFPPQSWDDMSANISKHIWFLYFPVFVLGCYAIAMTRWGPNWAASVQAAMVARLERKRALNILPSEPFKLFKLGQVTMMVEQLLKQLEAQGEGDSSLARELQAALHDKMLEAKQLLNQPLPEGMEVSPQLLLSLGDLLHQQLQSAPLAAQAKRFFKCANVMWVLGGLGVAVSIGPALAFVFGQLFKTAGEALKAVLLLAHDVFQPFYMALALGGCLTLLGASNRVPHPMAAQLTLLACLVAVFAMNFGFDCYMDGGTHDFVDYFAPWQWQSGVQWLFATAILLPFACVHNSQLLGFFTVGAQFFFWLSFIPRILEKLELRDDRYVTMCLMVVSASLLAFLLIARRATPKAKAALGPFNLGLNVFGSVMLLLLGLINSLWDSWNDGWTSWAIFWNVTYVPILTVLIAVGAIHANATLFNTGCTFSALYAVLQVISTLARYDLVALGVLLGSLGLCAGGYFIHTRPKWLSQMVID